MQFPETRTDYGTHSCNSAMTPWTADCRHRPPPPPPSQGRADRGHRKWCRAQQEAKERTKGKESLWLLEARVRNMILQMHIPVRTSQGWSRHTWHGLGVCIWIQMVNGTGNSPSLGQPTLE